jgi:hypothetical protein
MVLSTFGTLGWYGANHLHAYIKARLMPLIKPGEKRVVDGEQEVGSVKAEDDMAEDDSDVVAKEGGHIPSLWKGKGWLLKEESEEAIVVWPSDDENDKGEQQSLPPIEVLDDNDMAMESSRSF